MKMRTEVFPSSQHALFKAVSELKRKIHYSVTAGPVVMGVAFFYNTKSQGPHGVELSGQPWAHCISITSKGRVILTSLHKA